MHLKLHKFFEISYFYYKYKTKTASKQQPNPYVIELFLVFSFKMCHKCKDNFLI